MKTQEFFSSVNDFEILPVPTSSKNCLGVGSFGAVKLARHKPSNKKYALKIVKLNELESEAEVQSIKREIKVHSKLNHPHIIKFYHSFQTENTITMVLEYAERGNLYNHLKKKRKLSEFEAYTFFIQTLKAISFLHENDILHRDLKPENLLLDKNYAIKLCDFGWCCEEINRKRSTFCGTYEYMSPEVVFKKPYTTNIDVWALGVLLFELVTGSSPFKAKNLSDITQKFKNYKGDLFFPEYVPFDLKNLISGILRLNPENRLNINQILMHKWVKRMSTIKSANIENLSVVNNENDALSKRMQPEKINDINKEKKFQLPERTRTNLCDINDFSDRRFLTSPKRSIDLSITKVRKPIFFDLRKKTEMDSSTVSHYNKTEYQRYRSSNNTNLSNTSFLNCTHSENLIFKSIDNSKKHKIFKENKEKNPGTILKTMENLMSQITIPEEMETSLGRRLTKNQLKFEDFKKEKGNQVPKNRIMIRKKENINC